MARLTVKFNENETTLKVGFNNFYGVTEKPPDVEFYTGDYTVIPKVEAQSLQTAQKFLTDDVTIKSIPYYDVSNTVGGRTVFIGKELE